MCPSRFGTMCMAVALVLSCLSAASAQIDHRVNQGNELGTGRALDRNLGLGSGGVNPPAAPFDYGLRSNAIVTGNVTGLASFHASSPVSQSNQFRADLPSAGLSSFEARSASLQDVGQNPPAAPAFYFGRQETIADLGYIRSGLNVPGSSMLASPNTAPLRAGQLAVPRGGVENAYPGESPFGAPPSSRLLGIRQQQIGVATWRDPLATAASPFSNAAQSSIFGVPPPPGRAGSQLGGIGNQTPTDQGTPPPWQDVFEDQRQAQTEEDAEARPTGTLERTDPLGKRAPESRRLSVNRGSATGLTATDPGSVASRGATADSRTAAQPGLRDLTSGLSGFTPGSRQVEAAASPHAAQPQAILAGDSYTSMFEAVAAAQRLGVGNLAFELAPAKSPAGGTAGGIEGDKAAAPAPAPPRPDAKQMRRRADAGVADLAAAARWASDRLEHPVTTFVGTQQTRFNEVMAEAEFSLKAGAYYRAANLYSLAQTLNPDDPLPLLGRGHALAAAGDLRTAALMLERGIARFPHFAAFRLDLVALVGNRDVFDLRRAELERQLADEDSYDLRFLLGYLELYSGLEEEGAQNLEKAAKLAPPDSAVAAFPELLLGRRALPLIEDRSPAASTTAPAPLSR